MLRVKGKTAPDKPRGAFRLKCYALAENRHFANLIAATIVVATAGTTNAGTIDAYAQAAELATEWGVAVDDSTLHALAQEVFDELSEVEADRKIQLDLHPLPPALGTVAMIRQVWINLIGNAIKFTKEREIAVIEIGVTQGDDGGPVYYIKDNGVGFDSAFAHKLFQPFERLHGMEDYPGSGVGLATAKRIVTRHGGRIWCDSVEGEGTTFVNKKEILKIIADQA